MDPEQATIEEERSVKRQAGIHDTRIGSMNYYDVMLLGLTGQGKSTTADKLLIANRKGFNYRENFPDQKPDMPGQKMNEDLCMWLLGSEEDAKEYVSTRLKNLVFFRKLENPQNKVNEYRSAGMRVGATTLSCELLSNETSKLRILDVPGFFGAISAEQIQSCLIPGSPFSLLGQCTSASHLGIMKDILYIQTAMSMRFRRILYFLPCRGRLEKNNAALQQELLLMFHYFGRSIFETMVIIVTLPDITYSMVSRGEPINFPQNILEETRNCFQEVLKSFLGVDTPKPAAIFVSLTESCESILEKVKRSEVIRDGLQLQLTSSICVRCSMNIGSRHGSRVACTFGHDWSESILFENSFCHPILVPKYSWLGKFKEGVVYTLKTVWKRDKWKWPNFSDEVCHNCSHPAGSVGCLKVGTVYTIKEGIRPIIVDHSHELLGDHRYLTQDMFNMESSDESDNEAPVVASGDRSETDDATASQVSDSFFTPGDQTDESTPDDDTNYSVDSDIDHIPEGRLEHYQRQVTVDIEPTDSIDPTLTKSPEEPTPNVVMATITQVYPPPPIERQSSSFERLSSSIEDKELIKD